jgi:hypothetical protein
MTTETTSLSAEHAIAQEFVARITAFLGELWNIPLVRSVGIRATPEVELWVTLEREDVAVSKRILREHWLRFERALGPTIGLHVVPLDRIQRGNLPTATIIFER